MFPPQFWSFRLIEPWPESGHLFTFPSTKDSNPSAFSRAAPWREYGPRGYDLVILLTRLWPCRQPEPPRIGERPAPQPPSVDEPDYVPPDCSGSRRTRIGSRFIEQLVAGHEASDILRELVQNEYDGGGEMLTLTFGSRSLEVSGTGRNIDRISRARTRTLKAFPTWRPDEHHFAAEARCQLEVEFGFAPSGPTHPHWRHQATTDLRSPV